MRHDVGNRRTLLKVRLTPESATFSSWLACQPAGIGIGAIVWPLIDSMNPSADVLALSSVELEIGAIPAGQGVIFQWRGKPIFVRHRTPEEMKLAQAVPLSAMIDPATDAERVKAGHEPWVVMIGICTHLGCIPLGNKPTDPRGDFGGYFVHAMAANTTLTGACAMARRQPISRCRLTNS